MYFQNLTWSMHISICLILEGRKSVQVNFQDPLCHQSEVHIFLWISKTSFALCWIVNTSCNSYSTEYVPSKAHGLCYCFRYRRCLTCNSLRKRVDSDVLCSLISARRSYVHKKLDHVWYVQSLRQSKLLSKEITEVADYCLYVCYSRTYPILDSALWTFARSTLTCLAYHNLHSTY